MQLDTGSLTWEKIGDIAGASCHKQRKCEGSRSMAHEGRKGGIWVFIWGSFDPRPQPVSHASCEEGLRLAVLSSPPLTPPPLKARGKSLGLPDAQTQCISPSSPRTDSFRAGPEGRGRSAFPRRRPTYYTVTVPESCFPPTKPPLPHPAYHSCSEDSGSDVSSISHPTSPGSSSPDISFLRPLSPPQPPCHRGAWGPAGALYPKLLLPPGHLAPGRYVLVAESALPPPAEWELGRAALGPAYEEDLRWQRLVAPHGRVLRTPSLKDSPAGRALSKAAVSEELKSWHERARLRSSRPHSLDRQGAFRVRSLPPGREGFGRAPGPRTQVRRLRASGEGACRRGKGWTLAGPERRGGLPAAPPPARKDRPLKRFPLALQGTRTSPWGIS